MGCQISNNLVAPDPITLPPPPDARNRGFLQSSTKTTSPSETSLRNVVNINDILIDKTVRHTFADYVRHEKELIEEENDVEISKESEEEEMRILIQELIQCYRSMANEPKDIDNVSTPSTTTINTTTKSSDKPVHPSQESVRARNELLMLLAASNLPNFSQSQAYRASSDVSRKFTPSPLKEDCKDPT